MPLKSSHPKYQDEICHGLEIHNLENPLTWTVYLFSILQSEYPDKFKFLESDFIDKLYGSDDLRLTIEENNDVDSLINTFSIQEEKFNKLRNSYLTN